MPEVIDPMAEKRTADKVIVETIQSIRAKMFQVVHLMNQLNKTGARVEFRITQDEKGIHMLDFKAHQLMKLD